MESVRVLLALAAQDGWKVHYMDVRSAFLNGGLKEEVYVRQPLASSSPEKKGRCTASRRRYTG